MEVLGPWSVSSQDAGDAPALAFARSRSYGVWGLYLAEGEAGLRDRSSRPKISPTTINYSKALAMVELRRRRLTQARIASAVGVSKSAVGRVLRRATSTSGRAISSTSTPRSFGRI
jgi:hypothetical protein